MLKNKKDIYKTEDITVGFEFNYNGEDVIIITDYEKYDTTMKSVQIAKIKEPKKSAGQLEKELIINYLVK